MQRTGRQLSETSLSPATVGQNNFGLLWRWSGSSIHGQVYAQPLAVGGLTGVSGCTAPCNLIFIATEEDELYAFSADSYSANPVWNAHLAELAVTGGTYVNCHCQPGVIYPSIGVTGTPVINKDTNTLYVASAVQPPGDLPPQYWLHAINIKTGEEQPGGPIQIDATVQGPTTPPSQCHTGTGSGGKVQFDPLHSLQRTGLLLLHIGAYDMVYVGFTPVFGELTNGWILGYRHSQLTPGFTPITVFNSAPYGTGGGIWEDGAGLASDGSYIYVPIANGTFDIDLFPGSVDYGDSLVKLLVDPNSGALSVSDYYTPSDVFSYVGDKGRGRCINDVDFGSGGVLIFPDQFFQQNGQGVDLAVSGDKESNLYIVNRNDLGHYNANGGNLVQQITLPPNPPPENEQAYYSTPAYWKYVSGGQTKYALYYSAERREDLSPLPIYMYDLQSSDLPILSSGQESSKTPTGFCIPHGTTPTISANGTSGGILWAIENGNLANVPPEPRCDGGPAPAVLHAYDAKNLQIELYHSTGIQSRATKFSVPTVFKGKVYMGTLGQLPDPQTRKVAGEVDVFGPCGQGCVH